MIRRCKQTARGVHARSPHQDILVIIFFFLLAACHPVSADGMSFMGDPDMMVLQPEHDQTGAVFYENGYENLLLSVSLDWSLAGNQSVWIFPVPAQPHMVHIDLLKGFPTYDGTRVPDLYAQQIGMVALASASYATFPLATPYFLLAGVGISRGSGGFAGAPPQSHGDVIIYERVDKMGLSTELVTAKNASALTAYLSGRGFVIPRESLAMLEDYIAQDYSFVITSVGNVTRYREQFPVHSPENYGPVYRDSGSDDVLGVFVRFPTDRIYFPLKPTRAYGAREIPLLLTVNGHVTPQLPAGVQPYAAVMYMADDSYTPPNHLKDFFNDHAEVTPHAYTKILIAGPAHNYTEDLWLDTRVPPEVSAKLDMIRYYPLAGVILYIIFSAVASLLAGLFVFTRGSVSCRQLVRQGLWNCATMIGFVYATRRFLVITGEERKKRIRFVVLFYLIFLVLVMMTALVCEPSFATQLIELPLILLYLAVLGLVTGAAGIVPLITGHALYMPNDRALFWGTVLFECTVLVVFGMAAWQIIVKYLAEP